MSLPLETPAGVKPIHVDLYIVQAGIPGLLGMEVLDSEELVEDTVYNRLANRTAFDIDVSRKLYVDADS